QQSPLPAQMVLAEFMREGHFMRHIRRMRKLYNDKRNVFLEAIETFLGDRVEVGPHDTGMNTVLYLPAAVNDVEFAEAAWKSSIRVSALSYYYENSTPATGIVLGYTAVPINDIAPNIQKLADILALFLE
ncbi:MAG: PLP-dependent aminotransferase family protein, partial [Chloroflexi bacterium]|nr:PLP-dependent aminotransferase family protein [Chloroflexota bacterium]